MKLAIFDVDGTLTDTNDVDSQCFVDALAEEFGIRDIDSDWSVYKHTTDRGILTEVLRRAWSREPAEEELAAHRARFLALLAERLLDPRPIRGAVEFLDHIRRSGWSVVLCTGAWSGSARIKLARSGFPVDLPLSSCDEAEAREDIVRRGITMAGGAFDRIVVFGDAVWDLRAARNLGLPFIGVGDSSGAEPRINDYADTAAVLKLMSEVRAPR